MSQIFQCQNIDLKKSNVSPIIYMTTHALNDMKERPSSAIYVEMFVAFFANEKVVYQCKVSESTTLVVDESLSCKYNEL